MEHKKDHVGEKKVHITLKTSQYILRYTYTLTPMDKIHINIYSLKLIPLKTSHDTYKDTLIKQLCIKV